MCKDFARLRIAATGRSVLFLRRNLSRFLLGNRRRSPGSNGGDTFRRATTTPASTLAGMAAKLRQIHAQAIAGKTKQVIEPRL